MSQEHLVRNYSSSIQRLKLQCHNSGLSEEEFKRIYLESLEESGNRYTMFERGRNLILGHKRTILIVIIIIILYNLRSIYNAIFCNLQEYIYPGLRLFRHISIPFISLFPSLSELYDETCLIQNPYFTVVDMDCWPCNSVNNVQEVTDPMLPTQLQNAPFIYETDQKIITSVQLKELYIKNKDIFDRDASKLILNNRHYTTPNEMFSLLDKESEKNLFVWKFNNMHLARLLRQYIPRPKVVPKFGQSTERFLIIDTSQSFFKIPDTECNYSFLLSLKGSRQIQLLPADECKHQCKSLKVDLMESYLLWYNWWYWRPVVQPTFKNETFIAHVGSYC